MNFVTFFGDFVTKMSARKNFCTKFFFFCIFDKNVVTFFLCGYWKFIKFIQCISDYKAKHTKKWKNGNRKKKNRKFRNPGKKWRGFFAVFFCVFLTFSDPQKTPKINDYSPEHPFFGKTRKCRFREFREIPGNFLPEFSRHEFFSTIFHLIFINFYNFIIDCSR